MGFFLRPVLLLRYICFEILLLSSLYVPLHYYVLCNLVFYGIDIEADTEQL